MLGPTRFDARPYVLATALILATSRAPAAPPEARMRTGHNPEPPRRSPETPRRVIEEILVTAQKREQAAIDVRCRCPVER